MLSSAAQRPNEPVHPADVLRSYDFGEVLNAQTLSGGMFLKPLLLTTSRGRYVLRAHTFRKEDGLRFLGEVLEEAAASGLRCPRMLRNRAGEFGVVDGSVTYAVHEYIPGRMYGWMEWYTAKQAPGFLERIGAGVARVHDLLSRILVRGDATLDPLLPPIQFLALDMIRRQWEEAVEHLGVSRTATMLRSLRRELGEIWEAIADRVRSLQVPELPRQLIHGDLSPVNIVFCELGGELGLIDWDCLHSGLRLYDALGDVLNRPPVELADNFAVEWPNIRRYLDGYASAAAVPLTAAEIACVPLFLAARQLEDLRQRLHVLAVLSCERDVEYSVLARTRARLAADIIKDTPI